MRDSVTRYRLRVEEVGQDDPPADLRYVLGLYIDAPTWEDRLEFEITDRGVAELLYEMDGQEDSPICSGCGKPIEPGESSIERDGREYHVERESGCGCFDA